MNWELMWLDYSQKNKDKEIASRNLAIKINGNAESNRIEAACNELSRVFDTDSEKDPLTLLELNLNESSSAKDKFGQEGYEIIGSQQGIRLEAYSDRGLLYGVFALIRAYRLGQKLETINEYSLPVNPLRMINHWDNSDGSIERGYSGKSFFFEDASLLVNERTVDYARFMASTGINSVVINNVNVAGDACWLISDRYYHQLELLTEVFDRYGISLFLSVDYAAPIDIGGMSSADPLDPEVIKWWQVKMEEIYKALPDLGGFLIKADSEGRPGPFTYGRNQAQGANMLADAIKPYGGIIIWRCFVYNCQQDWRDRKTDRAKAGYDYFMPLDGSFHDNVVLQIKNGPMDFQVREPVSPLFGAMKKTNQILEVQIAQEYTGQQRHVCYLVPMWKEILDFDTCSNQEKPLVKEIASGAAYGRSIAGMAGVSNTGSDPNWTGHDLAAANLYGFGRLAWNPSLDAETIASEWIVQTFGGDKKVYDNLSHILLGSWKTYENYTSPLGIGWMVNPNQHYGPNVDGYEYDRWGTYHRADHEGIGVDRSDRGTGYTRQYADPLFEKYNKIETCPEELLLFFHYLPYRHRLPSGRTLIQHIYDTHFEGVEEVETMVAKFEELEDRIDKDKFQRIRERLDHQKEHAKEWRDVVNTYFLRKSGIQDEKQRKIY